MVATAYACTPAEIDVREGAAVPGQTVHGSGEGFSPLGRPVEIHFNSVNGNVVWSGEPSTEGNVSFGFEVPDVAPGHYTLIATQKSLTGGQSIAREPLRVLASAPPQKQVSEEGTGTNSPRASGSQVAAPRQAPVTETVSSEPAVGSKQPVAVPGTGARKPAARAERQVSAPAPDPEKAAAGSGPSAVADAPPGGAPGSDRSAAALALIAVGLLLSTAGLALVVARRRSEEHEPATVGIDSPPERPRAD